MCLILFAYRVHPQYRLVLAANRDEFYDRPTAPLAFWEDHPRILAGRDLAHMGTWLGITRQGRLAAVTNHRSPHPINPQAPSRGDLVADFLLQLLPPDQYLSQIKDRVEHYNGFNLLVGDRHHLYYGSNRGPWSRALSPGVYGLSNHLLNTPWPKVTRGIGMLKTALVHSGEPLINALINGLADETDAPDNELPQTGVERSLEKLLARIFIRSPTYGTRSSSVLLIDHEMRVTFHELSWQPGGAEVRPAGVRRETLPKE